jgi:DNA-binding NarL/FixJ family response regulator
VNVHGALAMAGDAASARDAWLRMIPAAQHPGFAHVKPELLLGGAWVAAAEGSLREAVTLSRQAGQVAASQHQPAVEMVALHTAVCFGDRTLADRLAELAAQVDGPRAPAAAAHAAALAVAAHARHGERGSAHAAGSRAHRLAQACEGPRTPALAALAMPLPLTVREREIVTLAAGGLSNRQIAERLVVSVRTVEGHLYRACAKLGVSDRTELASVVQDD